MDQINKKILSELQTNGRLSLTDLADRVGLSLSPCHRRVKALEDKGIIKKYSIELNYSKLGLNFSTLVFVTLKDGDMDSVQLFEKAVIDIPEIIQAQRLFGDPDYLLQVLTCDLESFQKLYDKKLAAIPSVQRLTTTMVMKNIIIGRNVLSIKP